MKTRKVLHRNKKMKKTKRNIHKSTKRKLSKISKKYKKKGTIKNLKQIRNALRNIEQNMSMKRALALAGGNGYIL